MKYAGLRPLSPILSPIIMSQSTVYIKALCLVIVGTVTGPIRDWLYGKRDDYQHLRGSLHHGGRCWGVVFTNSA